MHRPPPRGWNKALGEVSAVVEVRQVSVIASEFISSSCHVAGLPVSGFCQCLFGSVRTCMKSLGSSFWLA